MMMCAEYPMHLHPLVSAFQHNLVKLQFLVVPKDAAVTAFQDAAKCENAIGMGITASGLQVHRDFTAKTNEFLDRILMAHLIMRSSALQLLNNAPDGNLLTSRTVATASPDGHQRQPFIR